MVILDLEDGVAESDKESARHFLEQSELDPSLTIVRVNPYGTDHQERDLKALAWTPYDMVMLSKTESVEQVLSLSPLRVIALCETPLGILASAAIADCAATVGVMWGAQDLVAALGGRSSRQPDGRYLDVARTARSQVLLAAGAGGVASIDAVHLDIGDVEGLRTEATDAVASGFDATACIHPTQVAVVRQAYRPTDDEVAWARGVLAAAAESRGVFSYEGRMVDAPVLRHAEHIVDRAGSGSVTDS